MIFVRLILLCTLVSQLSAQCPSPSGLPPKTAEGKSMCARMYEHLSVDVNASCGGAFLEVYIGQASAYTPAGWNNRVSSMVVREGCTLTAYDGGPFKGTPRRFTGVIKDLNDYSRGFLGVLDWNDELSAYSCSCSFEPITCKPTAKWERVMSCDNRNHNNPTSCTHELKEGLSIGKSVTRGGSVSSMISATITSEMGATFAEVGSVSTSSSITESFTKEYNWGQSSSLLKSVHVLKKVVMTADPGKITELYQIIGRCGDTIAYTEKYKIVSV